MFGAKIASTPIDYSLHIFKDDWTILQDPLE